jgi:hypothetical protein
MPSSNGRMEKKLLLFLHTTMVWIAIWMWLFHNWMNLVLRELSTVQVIHNVYIKEWTNGVKLPGMVTNSGTILCSILATETKQSWVKKEYDLNTYTLEQIVAELQTASTLLKAIDGKTDRTFGYTCSNYVAGGKDFTGEIEKLFAGARCDGPMPETMQGYNIYKTPSWMAVDPSAEQLIEYVEKAREKGTIAVIMFHSVGGGYLNVGAAEHYKLLKYLKENEADYYCSTFLEVMQYIKNNR